MSFSAIIDQFSPAKLALADGSIFNGYAIGAQGKTVGEVVFNTSMMGYQEILTDPSYCQQIVTLTYPHIGNVGVNDNDAESRKVHAAGLIIRDLSAVASNWRSTKTLDAYLKEQGIVAIAGIDTRRLTRLLRDKGAQNGCILTDVLDDAVAIDHAKKFPGLLGVDLARLVSTQQVSRWTQGSYQLSNNTTTTLGKQRFHVVAYDFGVKAHILRLLVDRGCRVSLVPAQTSADEVLALAPDGVLLSNGPGDPAACDYAIKNIQRLLEHDIPLLGICLGFQLLALALNAATQKMKFGHHGANHPVQNVKSGAVFITSQNHSFVVDDEQLPNDIDITHRSLFDRSLQGFRHQAKPIIAFQGHPEATPGPQEISCLFDDFIALIEKRVG